MTHILIKLATQPFVHLAPQSFALLSDDPGTNRAAVFVHGFGGHPHNTWQDFPRLLASDSAWARTDAYFIGYSSVSDEPQLSATYLQNFLAKIIPTPPAEMFVAEARGMQAALRDAPTTYEDVVLYGHSLGGVVIRLALLEMIKRETVAATTSEATPPASGVDPGVAAPGSTAGVLRSALRLFAPAQGGARPAGLAGAVSSVPGLRALVGLYRGWSPTFQELVGGSQMLQALREDTTYFAEARPDLTALRAAIVWAHHDDVVSSFGYRHDASFTIANSTHKSVCKPQKLDDATYVFAVTGSLHGHPGAL